MLRACTLFVPPTRKPFTRCDACMDPHESIVMTLGSMTESRFRDYGPVESEITGIECTAKPVAAVVIAVYKSEPWG